MFKLSSNKNQILDDDTMLDLMHFDQNIKINLSNFSVPLTIVACPSRIKLNKIKTIRQKKLNNIK